MVVQTLFIDNLHCKNIKRNVIHKLQKEYFFFDSLFGQMNIDSYSEIYGNWLCS